MKKVFSSGKFRSVIVLIAIFIFASAVSVENNKYFEIAKNLEIFTNIYKELNSHYVDELDPNQLMRTGIDAIMNSLDPYTVYYSEAQVESYRISTEGKYNGLGASSQNIDSKVTLTEIYEGGPSQKAGLQIGDQLIRVNGQSTDGKSYDDVIQFIRGFPGTTLQISIFRPVENKTMDFTITRSEVDIPNVPYSGMMSDDIGYVALSTFTRDAGKNIAKAVRKMRDDHDLQGIVLDLRNNGGGLLSEAVDILGIFLPQGSLAVTTKGKVKDRDQIYRTRRMPIDTDLPLVVLVNKNSASASEIVSGALQDYDRAVIMGQRTYGKGLVQNHHEVGYNSRIKVTTSKYYIPSGRCIQSVQYENGEPKDIADNEREVFYTKKRRPVLDGGGVTPDIKLQLLEDPDILTTLEKEHWLFKFANLYVYENKEAPGIESFKFEDYDHLKEFLQGENFYFDTDEEIALTSLSMVVENQNSTLISDEISNIKKILTKEKEDDLDEFKDIITKNLEIELAKRYYFQEGKTRQNLKSDKEVDAAIKILKDPISFQAILQ